MDRWDRSGSGRGGTSASIIANIIANDTTSPQNGDHGPGMALNSDSRRTRSTRASAPTTRPGVPGPPVAGQGPGPDPVIRPFAEATTDREPGGPAGPGRIAGLARRAGWNVIAQVVSALTNSLLAVAVARTVSRTDFGAFSVAFLVFAVFIGVERAFVGQPMSIRYSKATGRQLHRGISRAVGTAAAVGLAGLVGCGLIGFVLGGALGHSLIAVGVMLPFLLMQDAARQVFFAIGRAKDAAINEGLWAVTQLAGIALAAFAGVASAPTLILIWGGSAGICVLVAMIQLGTGPALFSAWAWMREHRDLNGYLLAEYLLGAGAFQGGILAVGALTGGAEGLAVIGGFRAAQVLLGPLNMLATALQTFALPELSKRDWLRSLQRWRIALGIGGVMGGIALCYSAVLLLLPAGVGQALFRSNWDAADRVLLPMAIAATVGALCQGCAVVIYSMGLARRTFRIMAVEAPLVFTLMLGGAVVAGAPGAAWGMALDYILLTPLWFLTLRGVLRDQESSRPAA